MTVHQERRVVPHTPSDVFALVSDVRDYPNFIKWIKAMRVYDERVRDGVGDLKAEAIVGYKLIRERFATQVTLDRDAGAIDVAFVSGPFTDLENRWRFSDAPGGGTAVDFWIRFAFRNPLLQGLFDANFHRATRKLMNAFEDRARERFPVVDVAG